MANSSRTLHLTAFLVALPLLVGCVGQTAPTATPWPVPTPGADGGGKVAVSYPMPDLGPSPTPDPLTDADRETLRLEAQDRDWQSVTASYPDAVRPDVTFKGFLDEGAYTETLVACLEDAGIAVDFARDAGGMQTGIGWSTDNEEQTIAAYVCRSENPSFPMAPPNDEMLGYIYDYLTEFLAPCYAANGGENPPAPTREEFIANWPNQNWFPVGPWDENWAAGHSVDDVCPSQP